MHMHFGHLKQRKPQNQPVQRLPILRFCSAPALSLPKLESVAGGRARLSVFLATLCMREQIGRRVRSQRAAAPALADLDVEVLTDVRDDQKTRLEEGEDPQISRDSWVVLIHAESRSCRMPFCRVPFLGKYVCSCARDGVLPPPEPGFGALKSTDGTCTRGPTEIATDLQAAVSILSFEAAFDISMRLLQSASSNSVGSATVIGGSKKAAEGFRQRLAFYGFWASVVPVEPG
eukprot:TRINITY_DN57998_c0_g1_i1.p1 TRINITY_DN57998_c0_g1~~TRINITY_DN57998_c0_g1_i1.p1  ORF type:complete len:232 (-),score=26.33 TRINITY_DN57998_c0_g1_i1:436-1131(-)